MDSKMSRVKKKKKKIPPENKVNCFLVSTWVKGVVPEFLWVLISLINDVFDM